MYCVSTFSLALTSHRQAGISGSSSQGADSIVLSGDYEDDEDHGDVIVYTGYGGRDPATGKQVSDQPFTVWNRALAYSGLNGLPVRVVRGAGHDSPYSPGTGYSYDGLYSVDDYWHETGRSGFRVWRYRLTKLPNQEYEPEGASAEPSIDEAPDPKGPAPRRLGRVLRIVRDTQQARRIKQLHDYRCQMCGTRLEGAAGPYAEAGHIRPLGAPHNGPDTADNLLCLCPNHHVLFDHGGVAVADDLTLIGVQGHLSTVPQHSINEEHLRYRRDHYDMSR